MRACTAELCGPTGGQSLVTLSTTPHFIMAVSEHGERTGRRVLTALCLSVYSCSPVSDSVVVSWLGAKQGGMVVDESYPELNLLHASRPIQMLHLLAGVSKVLRQR